MLEIGSAYVLETAMNVYDQPPHNSIPSISILLKPKEIFTVLNFEEPSQKSDKGYVLNFTILCRDNIYYFESSWWSLKHREDKGYWTKLC